MSQGKARTNYLGREGLVQTANSPDWSFLYVASGIKDPQWNLGDRVVLPDGRVYRYARADQTNGVVSELGAANRHISNTNAVAPAQGDTTQPGFPSPAIANTGAVGSQYVRVTIASTFGRLGTGVLTQDELRGGYIVIGNGTSQHPQMRGIVGHPALAAAGALTLRLDAALTTAVTVGTTNLEVFVNPYDDVSNTGYGDGLCEYASVLGVPAIGASASQYFWLQTWGPCWVTSAGATSNGAYDRQLFWNKSGLVVSGADITIENGYQPAGFSIDASSSGNSNAPLVMLQQCP